VALDLALQCRALDGVRSESWQRWCRLPKKQGALEDLVEIGQASPRAAAAASAACAGVAGLGVLVFPEPLRTLAQLLWLVAMALVIGAAIGEYKRRERSRRLGSQRSVEDLHQMSWREFEFLVADTYRRKGYAVREGSGQRDGGVDLVLVGSGGRETLVQCKQYRNAKVGEPKVREFYGAMAAHGNGVEGLFVTCGGFTAEARRFAQGKPLELVDGPSLMRTILEVNGGGLPIPNPPPQSTEAPLCPKCQREMVRRVARSGRNAGSEFWGCPEFPRCRGTLPMDPATATSGASSR